MTKEEIQAFKTVLAQRSHMAPYWSGSPYVAETGSGSIDNNEYSDSAVLEVPLAEIPISEMYLVEIHDAESLVWDELNLAQKTGTK